MKLCLVYNPRDSKLRYDNAYCSIFKDMFNALVKRFDCRCFITNDCSSEDIDADLIFFFDPHASHHIRIDGIRNHPAVKMEYWNDLQQQEVYGAYKTTGESVHKLGARQRVDRFNKRGSNYIVSAVKQYFHEHFWEYFGDTDILLHFPHAPAMDFTSVPFDDRELKILGNGATWGGDYYKFREWAFARPQVSHVKHWVQDASVPMGKGYLPYISGYAGALALCGPFPVPKYIEMPAAGCLTFAEYHKDYEDLGFKDGETCIYVDKGNFDDRTRDFLEHPEEYKEIAANGQKVVQDNYTARHFADFIYSCAKGQR